MTPFSEALWREAQSKLSQAEKSDPPTTPDAILEVGLAVFLHTRFSMAANARSFAPVSRGRLRRGMNEQVSAFLTSVEDLQPVRDRLVRMLLLCGDMHDAIQRTDHPDTFFYIDPPFLPETRVSKKIYRHEMTPEQHQAMLDRLATIEGKFLLCSYPSSMYMEAIKKHGWYFHDRQIDNKASKKDVKPEMTARCIMNYRPETDLTIERGHNHDTTI